MKTVFLKIRIALTIPMSLLLSLFIISCSTVKNCDDIDIYDMPNRQNVNGIPQDLSASSDPHLGRIVHDYIRDSHKKCTIPRIGKLCWEWNIRNLNGFANYTNSQGLITGIPDIMIELYEQSEDADRTNLFAFQRISESSIMVILQAGELANSIIQNENIDYDESFVIDDPEVLSEYNSSIGLRLSDNIELISYEYDSPIVFTSNFVYDTIMFFAVTSNGLQTLENIISWDVCLPVGEIKNNSHNGEFDIYISKCFNNEYCFDLLAERLLMSDYFTQQDDVLFNDIESDLLGTTLLRNGGYEYEMTEEDGCEVIIIKIRNE